MFICYTFSWFHVNMLRIFLTLPCPIALPMCSVSQIDGLAQDCSNSSALAMELLQSWAKPSKYAHCCVVLCFVVVIWIHGIHLPISFRVASLALGQSYDCPSASEVTLLVKLFSVIMTPPFEAGGCWDNKVFEFELELYQTTQTMTKHNKA